MILSLKISPLRQIPTLLPGHQGLHGLIGTNLPDLLTPQRISKVGPQSSKIGPQRPEILVGFGS